MLLVQILLPLIAAGACMLLALLLASRRLRSCTPAVWLAAAVCIFHGTLAVGFQILGLAGKFTLGVVVPVFVVAPVAVVIHRRREVAALLGRLRAGAKHEKTELATAVRRHPVVLAGLGIIGVLVAVRCARALATTAFGWDDFTYHLFRAGQWVQHGGVALAPAPDAWTYYQYFPWGGDLIWAWALVWDLGDVLVTLGAIGVWCACFVLAYDLAGRWTRDRVASLVVATALVVLPSQITQLSTAYVDNVQLMLVLACGLLLLEFLRTDPAAEPVDRSRSGVAFLLGLGCGLGALVKFSFLPLLATATILIAWSAIRRRRLREVLAFALGTTILVPNLAFNRSHQGSPFYPFRVCESLPFNAQLTHVLAESSAADAGQRATTALRALVSNAQPEEPFLNPGFAGACLLVLGLFAGVRLWSQSARRPYLIWVAVGSAMTIVELMGPSNAALTTTWASVLGRHLVPTLAPILVLASVLGAARLRFLLMPVLFVEYCLYAPWRWPSEVLVATSLIIGVFVVAAIISAMVTRSRVSAFVKWTTVTLLLVVALSVTAVVHDRMRYTAYRLFAERRLDDFHSAGRMRAWPIWKKLDAYGPVRVAATAGWDGVGHNWFRYGLLGPRLERDVVYVPVTSDGSIVDYADTEKLAVAIDREAWLRRLKSLDVAYIVATGPRSVERDWIDQLPDVFSTEFAVAGGASILVRVNTAALAFHVGSR